jgi:betaine-aldehyde dehydrogenase
VAGCYEYYADLAEKLDDSQDTPIEVPMEEFKTVLRREPLGPVGLISAWNCALLCTPAAIALHACHSPACMQTLGASMCA